MGPFPLLNPKINKMQRRLPTPIAGSRGRVRGSQNPAGRNVGQNTQTGGSSLASGGRPHSRPPSSITARSLTPGTLSGFGNRGRSPSPSSRRRSTPARRISHPMSRPMTATVTATKGWSLSFRNSARNPRQATRPPSRASSSGSQGSRNSSRSSATSASRRRTRSFSSSSRQGRGSRTRASRSIEQAGVSSTTPLLLHDSHVSMTSSSHRSVLTGGVNRSPARRHSRSKSHVSFVLPDLGASKSSMKLVVESEKCLQQMFSYLNWNELLVVRQVSKKWLEMVSSDPKLKESSGVITIRKDFSALEIFNDSSIIWTQFRIYAPIVFDLTLKAQSEFWLKHGESMTFLELRSPCTTLSGLVEVLHRCPNLIHFLVTWTPEMYSFNPELIKKYYGVSIRNGTFAKMTSLTIEKSSYLTDNALSSLLKWCGSSLQNLILTCSPDEEDENLSRLKPRWTIEPIENFTNRFSYAKNLKFLDFSGSNLNSADLTRLGEMERLIHLSGIRLSHCKINDESTLQFLLQKGPKLEQLYLDYTLITENVFNFKDNNDLNLKKLLILDISGTQNFRNINFLPTMVNLEDFRCGDTSWLNYTMLPKPIEAHSISKKLTKAYFSNGEKFASKSFDENQRCTWFLHFCMILRKLTEIDLNHWTTFGTDENFKLICFNIPNLKKLRVRGWSNLTDEGVMGFSMEELVDMDDSEKDIWTNTRIRLQKQSLARLRGLRLFDLGGCLNITDISIQFGILYLPNLRALSLDGSQVTDIGIHVLIAKSKTLDKLSILGCDQTTPKGRKINRLDGRTVQFGSIRYN